MAVVKTKANFEKIGEVFAQSGHANFDQSKQLLQEKGLRFLTIEEAMAQIQYNKRLMGYLKGTWFYIAGNSPKTEGHYKLSPHGDLIKIKNLAHGELENTAYVFPGKSKPSMRVRTDEDMVMGRFLIDASYGPSYMANAVVGVKIKEKELKRA